MDPSVLRTTEVEGSPEGPAGCVIYVAEGADEDRSRYIELRTGSAVIGADAEAALVLHDPKVSRRHAELTITAHGVRFQDLGSTNGSYILGNKITQAELQLGGRVKLGSTVLVLLPIGDGRGIVPDASTSYGPLRGSST